TVTLDGVVFVRAGVVLHIDPGVTVQARTNPTSDPLSALVFLRDARIDAQGTADDPVVFTSDQPAGAKTTGAWGGLMTKGGGRVNVPGGEGLAEGAGTPFGGNRPNESSGTLSFARIEFAGRNNPIDNDWSALAMNALGRGTAIHHVETLGGRNDGF